MCSWCLAYCTGVVLNTVGESAMPDSKENKQANAGSRRFRRHFLCCALLCNVLSTEHEGLSTHTCPTGMVSRTFDAQHSVTKNLLYSSIIEMQIQSSYCVCVVFSSHSFWTSSSLDVPAGSHRRKVTQDFSSTFFLGCWCNVWLVFGLLHWRRPQHRRGSAMPDSKENKQANAGSRRFRRHFLCCALLLCNFLSTEHEGLSTHVQREWSAEPLMPSILSL